MCIRDSLAIALACGAKPVVTGTFREDSFPLMLDMLVAAAGGEERLRKRPIAVFDCCPTSPLHWSGLTAGALLDCARAGVPAEIVAMPMTGATAPATLAAAVAQHCAEVLSGVVIHQLAAPGGPVVYGGSPAAFDMRHGTTPMGAVETMMLDGANAEIGRRLGLPVHAYIALSDAKLVDYQGGFETGMGAAIAALSSVDLAAGPGMLDFESCQSPEKLLLDNEICGMARRLRAGIALREEPLARTVVAEGTLRGDFLSLSHTARWFRAETFFPGRLVDRLPWERWKKEGGQDAAARAASEAERILAEAPPPAIDPAVVRHLREAAAADLRAAGMDRIPDWY